MQELEEPLGFLGGKHALPARLLSKRIVKRLLLDSGDVDLADLVDFTEVYRLHVAGCLELHHASPLKSI